VQDHDRLAAAVGLRPAALMLAMQMQRIVQRREQRQVYCGKHGPLLVCVPTERHPRTVRLSHFLPNLRIPRCNGIAPKGNGSTRDCAASLRIALARIPIPRCVPNALWAALFLRGMNPQAFPTPGFCFGSRGTSTRPRTWSRRLKRCCPSPNCFGRCLMSATFRRTRRRTPPDNKSPRQHHNFVRLPKPFAYLLCRTPIP
jgi:hypothetical protein